MLFLNMALLFGLAGIAIPILIHLFHRRSEKKVEWGAMRFLIDSLVSRRRRILLEEILLLGARCLLMALLALAMARPFIPAGWNVPWIVVLPAILLAAIALGAAVALWRYPRWRKWVVAGAGALLLLAGAAVLLERHFNLRRFGAGHERDVVLVIDGSSSMTIEIDGKTNFERAREEAEQIIKQAGRRTAFGIVLGSDVASARLPAPVSDRRTLFGLLDELQPTHGAMRPLDALALSAVVLAQGYNPSKQIVVITDGQDFGWAADQPSRWQFLRDTFANLPSPPQIIVRQLGLPPALRNIAVSGLTLSRGMVGTDREVTIRVRVENTGVEAVTPSMLEVTAGGKTMTDVGLDQLEPGAAETVVFRHRFEKAGSHVITARVVVDDQLADDNTRSRVVSVLDNLPVLVVDGNPSGRFLERAGAFAYLALSPRRPQIGNDATLQSTPVRYLMTPKLVAVQELPAEESLDDYSVIILADVPRLAAEEARRLARYVREGGGLIVAPGGRAQPEFYAAWQTEEGKTVCPARLVERVERRDEDQVLSPSATTFSHSALRVIAEAGRSDIGSVNLAWYWRLQEDALETTASVGGRLVSGDPLLVEKRLGEGTVLLLCCSLDTQCGNLVTRQAFLPMLHEMVDYLARSRDVTLSLEPGQGLNLQLSPPSSMYGKHRGLQAAYYGGDNFE